MNITPTLPNPQPPAQPPQRRTVAAVDPAQTTRNAAEQSGRRLPVRPDGDEPRTAALQAGAGATLSLHQGHSVHVHRALAAYARVAGDGERRSLRDVLGFDGYA